MDFKTVEELRSYLGDLTSRDEAYKTFIFWRMLDVEFTKGQIQYMHSISSAGAQPRFDLKNKQANPKSEINEMMHNAFGQAKFYLGALDTFFKGSEEEAYQAVIKAIALAEVQVKNFTIMTDLSLSREQRSEFVTLGPDFENSAYSRKTIIDHVDSEFLPAMKRFVAREAGMDLVDVLDQVENHKAALASDPEYMRVFQGYDFLRPFDEQHYRSLGPAMKFDSIDALMDYMDTISKRHSEYRVWLDMRMRDVNFTVAEIEYLEGRDVTGVREDLASTSSAEVWRETLPRVLFNTIGKGAGLLDLVHVFPDEAPENDPAAITKTRVYAQVFMSAAFAEMAIENLYKAMRMSDLEKGQKERKLYKNLKNMFENSEETIFDEDLYLNHIYDDFLPAMAEFLGNKLGMEQKDVRTKIEGYKQKFVDDIYFGSALNGIETYPPININDWYKLSPNPGADPLPANTNE